MSPGVVAEQPVVLRGFITSRIAIRTESLQPTTSSEADGARATWAHSIVDTVQGDSREGELQPPPRANRPASRRITRGLHVAHALAQGERVDEERVLAGGLESTSPLFDRPTGKQILFDVFPRDEGGEAATGANDNGAVLCGNPEDFAAQEGPSALGRDAHRICHRSQKEASVSQIEGGTPSSSLPDFTVPRYPSFVHLQRQQIVTRALNLNTTGPK